MPHEVPPRAVERGMERVRGADARDSQPCGGLVERPGVAVVRDAAGHDRDDRRRTGGRSLQSQLAPCLLVGPEDQRAGLQRLPEPGLDARGEDVVAFDREEVGGRACRDLTRAGIDEPVGARTGGDLEVLCRNAYGELCSGRVETCPTSSTVTSSWSPPRCSTAESPVWLWSAQP